jgi:hypothetical protein
MVGGLVLRLAFSHFIDRRALHIPLLPSSQAAASKPRFWSSNLTASTVYNMGSNGGPYSLFDAV